MRIRTALLAATFILFAVSACDVVHCDETKLRVSPSQITLNGELDRVQIIVNFQTAEKSTIDVTPKATYTSKSPGVVTVSSSGRIAPKAPGKTVVRVAFSGSSVDVPVEVTASDPRRAVSFVEDVIPVLTKSGCNQGACHGGQFGQGGFKLSLLGFAPEQDYPAMARDWKQRRISLIDPANSLILRKAVAAIPHGGGRRMSADSAEFQVLARWMKSGAPGPKADEPHIAAITVTPRELEYRPNDSRQLRVVAKYSDGSERDVTHRARYDSLGKGIATVTRDGFVTAAGEGQTAIMVRYRGRARVSSVVRPFADKVDLSDFQLKNYVDQHVRARWQKLGLRPSPECSDEHFIRRAFLASIGTLPTPEAVQRFLASEDANKRDTRTIKGYGDATKMP